MKLVLDTNVLVSGIFFSGPPYRILQAWQNEQLQFVISLEILNEYQRVASIMGTKFEQIDIKPIMEFLMLHNEILDVPPLPEPVCADPDDDMFIACALASKTPLIVSGDKHLLDIDGFQNLRVLTPKAFVDQYLH